MKISVDDVELYTLSDHQMKVMKDSVRRDIFDEDMNRRLQWVLVDNKYVQSFKRLKDHWDPILRGRVPSIPTDPVAYADLVFEQVDYKDRQDRDALDVEG